MVKVTHQKLGPPDTSTYLLDHLYQAHNRQAFPLPI